MIMPTNREHPSHSLPSVPGGWVGQTVLIGLVLTHGKPTRAREIWCGIWCHESSSIATVLQVSSHRKGLPAETDGVSLNFDFWLCLLALV